jgi:RimJ/RimL family protein N-acetyltransferase
MPGPGHLCDGTCVTIRDRIDGSLAALTPLSVADAAAWTRWLNDISTIRYLYGRRERPSGPVTMREMLTWGRRMLADPIRLAVGIEDLSSGQVVGNARLVPVFGGRSRFSIVIGEAESRGRGLGTEATRMLCRYGFDQMGIREIILDVDPRNEPAVRAYRSAGFVPSRGWTMRLPAAAAPPLRDAARAAQG